MVQRVMKAKTELQLSHRLVATRQMLCCNSINRLLHPPLFLGVPIDGSDVKDLREEVRFVVAPCRRGVSPERLGVN